MANATAIATARLPVTWLEVFADQPLGGNLHVVVHDADVLDDATLAAFARRMRLSETSYVQSPSEPGADYRHRIFTMVTEIPFAGHPSLGTAAAVARARGERSAHLVQQTGAGLQPLRVDLDGTGASATVEISQNPPAHLGDTASEPLLAALGLARGDGRTELPASVISTGLPTLVLPVKDLEALQHARPDLGALSDALVAAPGSPLTCYVVVPPGAGGDGSRWRARCFTDQVGGGEDAATGSAAGPLTAYAHLHLGADAVEIDQGVELGSPSRLSGRVDGARIVVAGNVRFVGAGTIELPARA